MVDDQLVLVDLVIEKLNDHRIISGQLVDVQAIKGGLLFLRSLLGDIEELCHQHEVLESLWDHILTVAYKVECFIDRLHHQVRGAGLIEALSVVTSASIIKDIEDVKADVLTHSGNRGRMEVEEVTKTTYAHVPLPRTPSTTNEVVGFDEDAVSILNRVQRGSKHLKIIAIVGKMAGLGKTTLAAKVYNDPSILLHFSIRAWAPISQSVDKGKVLLDLLN
ncbi:OLC1v1020220C1 [Oldenlandia corymbosa var. corymbosa]|uniref:OLC1v1020220C1 n=1 Tax=Oldenlandia corymbosa var. corymbosa TaxID=529605 RepID=A0AAV1EFU4_OLDCO|nr:OLC1v1020220C1 [Oldenlandia corymbosa var. corymbosa]